MPTLNLGRVGFVNKGIYVAATALVPQKVNNIVQYNNATYACIQYHETEHLPTDTLYWQKWSELGIHIESDISNTVKSTSDTCYINSFTGVQTGVISIKIAGLIAATATSVNMNYLELIITQDDRDKTLGTNPQIYKFLVKANMDIGVWYNAKVMVLGVDDGSYPINVRFTRTATDAYIEIGDIGSSWSYPTIEISHVTDYIKDGYTKIFIATLQNSILGTTTDSIVNIGSGIHNLTTKATPVDADELGFANSTTGFSLVKFTWANLKTTLFSSPALSGTPTAPTAAAGTNTTQLATTAGVIAQIPASLNATGTAPIYACRAWVNFNGTGVVAIRGSGNVSSITDNGTGDYTLNLTTSLVDANYSAQFTSGFVSFANIPVTSNFGVGSIKVRCFNANDVIEDASVVCGALFR